jgi:hypothetical protein
MYKSQVNRSLMQIGKNDQGNRLVIGIKPILLPFRQLASPSKKYQLVNLNGVVVDRGQPNSSVNLIFEILQMDLKKVLG